MRPLHVHVIYQRYLRLRAWACFLLIIILTKSFRGKHDTTIV